MSSRNCKSSKSTAAKGKLKKQDHSQQLKRQKQETVKSSKGRKPAVDIRPVAKIPSSREESSCNWKALLQTQGKSLAAGTNSGKTRPNPTRNMEHSKDVKRSRNSGGPDSRNVSTERSRSISESRCPSQLSMTSEAASSVGTDSFDTESEAGTLKDASQKVKQEFRALGLSESNTGERQSRGAERAFKGPPQQQRRIVKKPPPEGLNEFGYFDYSHYGVLRTPITQAHAYFMQDTGIIAMDCEMVGVGPMKESALARVSVVNEYGFCLYDRFVKPKVEVTDYRTQFSGIRENDLKNAIPFQIVAKEVAEILKGHILVGHSLKSDLAVLYLSHPKAKIRDTAFFFKKILHSKTPKLKMLVKKLLGVEIQQGEHSSITDAQATMALYQLYKKEWEISARQMNRGIDVLKQTLEEFRQLRANAVIPSQAPVYSNTVNNNNIQKSDWYDTPDDLSIAAFSNNLYSACPDGCCGDSTGASPSESPPTSLDSISYSIGEANHFSNQQIDEPPVNYPHPGLTNAQYMPYQAHPIQAPIPHPPVPIPCYSYGGMNGMFIPSMGFPTPHRGLTF